MQNQTIVEVKGAALGSHREHLDKTCAC